MKKVYVLRSLWYQGSWRSLQNSHALGCWFFFYVDENQKRFAKNLFHGHTFGNCYFSLFGVCNQTFYFYLINNSWTRKTIATSWSYVTPSAKAGRTPWYTIRFSCSGPDASICCNIWRRYEGVGEKTRTEISLPNGKEGWMFQKTLLPDPESSITHTQSKRWLILRADVDW